MHLPSLSQDNPELGVHRHSRDGTRGGGARVKRERDVCTPRHDAGSDHHSGNGRILMRTRRLVGIIAALLMTIGVAVPALADDDTTVNVTITAGTEFSVDITSAS